MRTMRRPKRPAAPAPLEDRADSRFWGAVLHELPAQDGVAVILSTSPSTFATPGEERLRAAGAHTVSIGPALDDAHDALARLHRVDLVVDLRPSSEAGQAGAWRALFLHLVDCGRWVARRTRPTPGDSAVDEPLLQLMQRVTGGGSGLRTLLAEAVAGVRVEDEWIVITKRGEHLLPVRDADAMAVLAEREPALSVEEWQTMPGGTLDHSSRVTHYPEGSQQFDEVMPYPPLRVRRYQGEVVLRDGPLVLHHRSVLPESFRWHLAEPLTHERLRGPVGGLVLPKGRPPEGKRLKGSFYYLDYRNTGHYGHLMTEALSRLWGWHDAKREDPDLKILCRLHSRTDRSPESRPESTLLPAYGIAPADVTWFRDAAEVDTLVGASPMWHNAPPFYVHPGIRQVWERIRDGLPAASVPTQPYVFVTRRAGNRPCRNVVDVERFFVDRGFSGVMPGSLSLPEQAAVFGQARVVAGFGGTGMFNLALARDLTAVVVLNHTAYDARNEHLFAAAHGVPADFFWSEPDVAHPPGQLSYRARQSAWRFDFDLLGEPLDERLRQLVR